MLPWSHICIKGSFLTHFKGIQSAYHFVQLEGPTSLWFEYGPQLDLIWPSAPLLHSLALQWKWLRGGKALVFCNICKCSSFLSRKIKAEGTIFTASQLGGSASH